MATRIRQPRPIFDYSGGGITWYLIPLPPFGLNHSTQLARWAATPHIYKRRESKLWEVSVKAMTHGWVPPHRTPLVVAMTFYVPKADILSLDVDKWAPVVVDAAIGARYDQWVFDCSESKTETLDGQEPGVSVRVTWLIPEKRRRGP